MGDLPRGAEAPEKKGEGQRARRLGKKLRRRTISEWEKRSIRVRLRKGGGARGTDRALGEVGSKSLEMEQTSSLSLQKIKAPPRSKERKGGSGGRVCARDAKYPSQLKGSKLGARIDDRETQPNRSVEGRGGACRRSQNQRGI